MFRLISGNIISCTRKPLCVHVACTLVIVCTICRTLASIVGRGVLTPLFYEDPPILPTPFFEFCQTIPSLLPWWSRHTHKAHTGASRLTHLYKHIYTPVMCSQQLSLLHWMDNSLISKSYFRRCLFFSRIIHLQRSYICWVDAIRLGSANNTGVSTQNTHTYTKHSKKDNIGKGQYENKWYHPFLTPPPSTPHPYFISPSLFYGKNLNPPFFFFENFVNSSFFVKWIGTIIIPWNSHYFRNWKATVN